ncbi:Dps DNA-binding ferritin-like protein (oxidative damage protectant) [uncultured Caudovirales phage]|uniref:Dps DNA-binding ferritin-like protein (Oxidative damage protectant) n=1 Tax=uncultured Caudovirales phage TaxID=2100421 RepID=A0A6J7WWI6_9CAUD|nr:Dps DNA-binding ferritin-like protein (oxidative damage protectant) [uncultured Caudovirales phage]
MDELIASTKVALANTFIMYFKTHSFHWNIEGIEFPQYHEFFQDIYEDVYGAVDPLAENLRKLQAYAPISLMQMYNYKTIEEESSQVVLLADMLSSLQSANDKVIESLNKVFDLATAQKEQGLANFVADRIDNHKKHGWMIRASLKKIEG